MRGNMVQPQRRALNPLSTAVAAVLLLVAVIGAFWVPFYARSAPKLGDFPFFYWYQLIWMPVVMVLCYLAYLLMRTTRTGRRPRGRQRLDGRGRRDDHVNAASLTMVIILFVVVTGVGFAAPGGAGPRR